MFEMVSRKLRRIVIGDRIKLIIINLAQLDVVTLEQVHDFGRVTNHLRGLIEDRKSVV